jgi:uncharacterized protein (TIGR03435 family)
MVVLSRRESRMRFAGKLWLALLLGAALSGQAMITLAQAAAGTEAAPAEASATSSPLAFDVVTITRSASGAGQTTIQSPPNGDSVIIRNMPVRMILGFAYDQARYNSFDGLPPWADTENYDITAKVAAADLPAFHKLLPRERNPMLRPMLAERFHLQSHFESRQVPAYALVVAKGGARLTDAQPQMTADASKDPGGVRMGRGELVGTAAPIAPLLDALSVQLGRPVVDRTGLTGRYSFTLKFAPAQAATDAQSDAGPSLFTAVEDQLGLRLESTRAPVPVLVVDHIERPSAN